jgi:hypothetical protein
VLDRIAFRISRRAVDLYDDDDSALVTPMNPWRRLMLVTAGLLLLAAVGGCSEPTGPKTVTNPDLSVKIPAMKSAADSDSKDPATLTELVHDLDSDDAAVRFYAAESLQRLSGQDFGYRYYDPVETRKPAVEKWRQWLSEQKH